MFWDRYGATSAQRRGAVRSVITTAVADNSVPRDTCARALNLLAGAGKQITPETLTGQLRKMKARDFRPLIEGVVDEPMFTPAGRYCTVRGHETTQLTPAGLCPNCAGDSRAKAWGAKTYDEYEREDDQPPDPTIGALLLDHGGGHEIEMHPAEARAKHAVDLRYLEGLDNPEHWRDLADEYLDAQHPADDPDYEPNPNAVDAVAAELHRRWVRRARTTVDPETSPE